MHLLKMLRCILSFAGIAAESCAQLADRAFARGIVSSSSFVDDAATARGGDLIMSAAALSKYTSSTDISRKSRSKVHAALSLRRICSTPSAVHSLLVRSAGKHQARRPLHFAVAYVVIALCRLTGDGQIGQLEKMDGKNPTLSMPLPDGSKLVRPLALCPQTTVDCIYVKSREVMLCDVPFSVGVFGVRVPAELPARRFFVARSCIQKRRLRCCSCRRKAAARFHATRYFCMCLYAAVFDVMRRFSVLLLFLLKVTL